MFRPLSWLPFLCLIALSISCYIYLDARWGMFLIGMMMGAILRIISSARLAIRAWPLTTEITDWSKVDAICHKEKA